MFIVYTTAMPVKKKKKSKKKSKKKVYDPPVYQIPVYDDPDLVTPRVELTIRHGTVEIPDDAMVLKLTMMITSTIDKVGREIKKHHQGAIKDITICKDRFQAEEALPSDSTLEKCGITGAEAKLFYDFVPITYPLLG